MNHFTFMYLWEACTLQLSFFFKCKPELKSCLLLPRQKATLFDGKMKQIKTQSLHRRRKYGREGAGRHQNNRREVMALLVDIWPSICVLSYSPLFKRSHSLTGKTQKCNKNTTQPLEKKKILLIKLKPEPNTRMYGGIVCTGCLIVWYFWV